MTGVEPAHLRHQNLNLARLPIPPHPHILYFSTKVLKYQLFYSPITLRTNAAKAPPSATVRSPRRQYARRSATTHPPTEEVTDAVLLKTAGKVIAASTV